MGIVLRLGDELRGELKEPMGKLYTDAEQLLAESCEPVIAVGDVVTYHLVAAGHIPRIALVDDRTQRGSVDREIVEGIAGFDRTIGVENPPATLTEGVLSSLAKAVPGPERTLIEVEGEEDLAALPAILVAPDGASVVYGQPDEGMVLVTADAASRRRARDILTRMDGDTERALSLLGFED